MPDERWENLKHIFHAAIALPHDERQSYFEKDCGTDSAFRHSAVRTGEEQ